MRGLWAAVRAWWVRRAIARDPNPEYSFLDHLDGLGALEDDEL